MSEAETTVPGRFLWPAEYYSGPSPRAVLPRPAIFGCGGASLVALMALFAGGAFLSSGGLVGAMDLVFGMTMGEVRGMYTAEVTAAQKKELETAVEALRASLREEKIPVAALDPVLQTMRKAVADEKMQPDEVEAVTAAALKAVAR